jgi:hypothetical protein
LSASPAGRGYQLHHLLAEAAMEAREFFVVAVDALMARAPIVRLAHLGRETSDPVRQACHRPS